MMAHYLDSCISGQTNSNTSLVGNALIFSDRKAGMDSSKTQPRRGRRSLVLTKTRYIHWSLPSFSGSILRGCRNWLAASLPWVKGGTFSRRSEMATAPRFSSMPNQFWWSAKNKYIISNFTIYLITFQRLKIVNSIKRVFRRTIVKSR